MLEQLTPRVFYLPFSKTEGSPSLGYIRGDRFSLMVDAGTCPAHVGEYQNAVTAAGFRPPDFVALTHSHWDPCFKHGSLWNWYPPFRGHRMAFRRASAAGSSPAPVRR